MPEQIRTLNKYKENDAKRERDRVGQRQRYGVESTPGITYRQHLLLSVFQVTQIFVSGSQVAPWTQWLLKPAHVWLISRSECMNNQLVSWYLTRSQLLCVHQKETACNCCKHDFASKKVFPNTILGFRFVSRSLVPARQSRCYNDASSLKVRAIASTVHNDDPRIVQRFFYVLITGCTISLFHVSGDDLLWISIKKIE